MNFKVATLLLALATATGGISVSMAQSYLDHRDLEARAERVFETSRKTGKIPAHLIRQLSLAMTFQNYEGAERLINSIQSQSQR